MRMMNLMVKWNTNFMIQDKQIGFKPFLVEMFSYALLKAIDHKNQLDAVEEVEILVIIIITHNNL